MYVSSFLFPFAFSAATLAAPASTTLTNFDGILSVAFPAGSQLKPSYDSNSGGNNDPNLLLYSERYTGAIKHYLDQQTVEMFFIDIEDYRFHIDADAVTKYLVNLDQIPDTTYVRSVQSCNYSKDGTGLPCQVVDMQDAEGIECWKHEIIVDGDRVVQLTYLLDCSDAPSSVGDPKARDAFFDSFRIIGPTWLAQ